MNKYKSYFEKIDFATNKALRIATNARKKGYDPCDNVEIPLTKNLSERVEGLISVVVPQIRGSGIVERINELEKIYGFQDWRVALTIALEVAQEKFCKFKNKLEAMEVGIRVGFAYTTVGVVVSPLEGFVKLKLNKRMDGKEYFCLYFSGPVRSAGGTGASTSILIADYIRREIGYSKYDPSEIEVKRQVTEVYDYHEKVTNLQYYPSEDELTFLVKNLPVQISGDPSEKYEVSNYRDLERIETNLIRNGVALVLAECLALKAPKILKQLNLWGKDFGFYDDWLFLNELVDMQKKIRAKRFAHEKKDKIMPDYNYIQDLVAGRPIFSHPLAKGGFRLRYGRCRNSGLSSQALHPATMIVLDGFIAVGTQLKVERPGKATVIASCDSIDGPIVKLNNGDVIKLDNEEEARKVAKDIIEIIYLGDLLVNYGDFLNRAHVLVPAGYCEEWWQLESGIDKIKIDIDEAIKHCKNGKPLHPMYTFYWSEINRNQLLVLIEWLKKGSVGDEKIILPYSYDRDVDVKGEDPKRVLELLGVPHKLVKKEHVVIGMPWNKALIFSLGNDLDNIPEEEGVLDIVNKMSGVFIRDKSGTTIGARMGRPEKAKLRKMIGTPHILFPVGKEGGRLRCFQSALEKNKITAEFCLFFCEKCKKEAIYSICGDCGSHTKKKFYCFDCGIMMDSKCEKEYIKGDKTFEHKCVNYVKKQLDIKKYFDDALNLLGVKSYPDLIKGVRGTSNEGHVVEHLVKGILRAMYGLYVNKDGTIRYDMTETCITHFKPEEIGTSVEKLKELGYEKDIYGKELRNYDQIIEIKIQDIILPSCSETLDEKGDEAMSKVANFVDDCLERLYGLERFYNIKTREDLIGHLVLGMSPHTSAGVIGRIIGFSNTQGFYCHPYFHCLMRRDCLGSNNYVSIKQNDEWQIRKIGEFIDDLNPTQRLDNFGTLKKILNNTYTWSNPGEGKIREVTKHRPNKLFKIYLEDGRYIELTGSHKVYTKGKKEKRVNQLNVGDKLLVNYKKDIPEKDIKEIFLPNFFKGREDVMIRNIFDYLNKFEKLTKHENFCQRDSFPIKFVEEILIKHGKNLQDLPLCAKIAIKRDNVSIPINLLLEKDLLEVMGLYIAEGHLRKKDSKKGFYQVSISSTDEKNKELIKNVFSLYFDLGPTEDHYDHLTFSSRIIYELFKDYFKFGERAELKRIPSMFLNLKKDKLAALLRGYYEGDGSVSKTDIRVTCDTVSEGLKHDLSFVLSRFGIFTKFYEYEKEPGPKVRLFYLRKNRKIPKFKITKIIIPSNFVKKFEDIGFLSKRKNNVLKLILQRNNYGMRIDHDESYVYPKIKYIEKTNYEKNYCFNVKGDHNFFANDILVHNCDGDEACVILLLDALINFSRSYIPGHRGAKQDEPLVISSRIIPSEVDDMVFDMDIVDKYPLELYEAALQYKNPWEVKIKTVKDVLKTDNEFEGFMFTHNTSSINLGVMCSSYKIIPLMMEKVEGQMKIAEKVRAVDESDVARLILERHFIRDIKGNLRKYSMQQFRCVDCNEKYRRPPLIGKCKCGGKLIFTISQGSIVKYLGLSLFLADKYDLPNYIKQTLELTKLRIESEFGKLEDRQEGLIKWFK